MSECKTTSECGTSTETLCHPVTPSPRHPVTVADAPLEVLRQVVRQHGTPTYAYDLSRIRRQVARLREHCPPQIELFYSFKANPSLGLCGFLADCGVGADVASASEIVTAREAGFTPDRLLVTGPDRSPGLLAELRAVPEALLSIDSPSDLEQLAAQGVANRCLLRLRPDFHCMAVCVVGPDSRFGVRFEELARCREFIGSNGINVVGFHVFAGSQVLDPAAIVHHFRNALDQSLRAADVLGIVPEVIDLGGGFGVPYSPGDDELDLGPIGKTLHELVERAAPARLFMELGRYFVAQSGWYLTSVLAQQTQAGRKAVVVDGGTHQRGDMCGSGLRLKSCPIPLVSRSGSPDPTDVLGVLSHPGDVLAEAKPLPPLEPGDVLAFAHAGAYGLCASSWSFNGHPMPAEVAFDGNKIETIRARQSTRAVLEGQTRLPPAKPVTTNGKHVATGGSTVVVTKKTGGPPVATREGPDQQHFIGGQWRPSASGKTFPTINPATGATICQVAAGDAADVDLAVRAARKALDSGPWSTMDAADRGRLLLRLADLVEGRAKELAALESQNSGKLVADALGDVQGVVNTLRYYGGWADKIEGRTIPVRGSYLSYTLRQPVGVIGQIIPWNFPLLMLAWKWGPALACGNTVVLKPAEQTPLTALRLAQLTVEAGFPPGVINVVNGLGETAGAALVANPGVDKIAFTGHVDTAKIIQRSAADTLKRTTFELGGKSPNVVFADAPLKTAVAGAFHAIYFHGGQCCTAGSRLFVEEKIHGAFVEQLADLARKRKLGDPLQPDTEQGPQVSQEQLDKILGYVDLGQKQGARLLTGGHRVGDRGFFVEPTIFDNVTDDMAIARDEIFGPVVSVLKFKSVDEVIDRANQTAYGLAAAVWTKDIDKAHLFAQRVKAGTVWVNCYHVVDAATPFGGFKMSGQGRENGAAALEHYTELKTVTVKLGDAPPPAKG
jgi:aldehyde dehydrogenase (NAD+)